MRYCNLLIEIETERKRAVRVLSGTNSLIRFISHWSFN